MQHPRKDYTYQEMERRINAPIATNRKTRGMPRRKY